MTGEYDESLQKIRAAIERRLEQTKYFRTQSLRVGDKVKFISGRPHYLIGTVATVRDVKQTYVHIVLNQTVGKFRAGFAIRTPIDCLEKV